MKNLLYLLLISFITLSCKNNKEEIQETSLIGKWKLIEVIGSPGFPTDWVEIESNCIIEFFSDNSTSFFECDESELFLLGSSYEILDESIIKIYSNNIESNISYILSESQLTLDGAPFGCDETCAQKFERINQ